MNPSQDTVMHDALPVTQPPLPNTIALDDTDLSSVSLPSRNRLNARAQSVNNRKNAGESVELGTREEEKEEVTVENVDEELDEEDIEEEEEDEEDFDDEDDGEYGKPASSRRISKPVSRLPASASNPDLKPMAVVAHPKKQTSSGPAPVIYSAVYSGVEVYEMVVEDNPVMRRAFDSYMNATQLLKLAGFSKPKRTKILEKEIHTEVHEKIQGGFGKYQGTWVPPQVARTIARRYDVEDMLLPLFNFDPKKTPLSKRPAKTSSSASSSAVSSSRVYVEPRASARRRPNTSSQQSLADKDDEFYDDEHMYDNDVSMGYERSGSVIKRQQHNNNNHHNNYNNNHQQHRNQDEGNMIQSSGRTIRQQRVLEEIFYDGNPVIMVDLLKSPHFPGKFDVDMIIDEEGHTCLHWAAAMGRVRHLAALIDKGADMHARNFNNETGLIRAVLVTNNFELGTFKHLLEYLGDSIYEDDIHRRTVLHHITMSACSPAKVVSSKYYANCLVDFLERVVLSHEGGNARGNNGNNAATDALIDFLDSQDKDGQTALHYAVRSGQRGIVKGLLRLGASTDIPNNQGLTAQDFARMSQDEKLMKSLRVTADTAGNLRARMGESMEDDDDTGDDEEELDPSEIARLRDQNDVNKHGYYMNLPGPQSVNVFGGTIYERNQSKSGKKQKEQQQNVPAPSITTAVAVGSTTSLSAATSSTEPVIPFDPLNPLASVTRATELALASASRKSNKHSNNITTDDNTSGLQDTVLQLLQTYLTKLHSTLTTQLQSTTDQIGVIQQQTDLVQSSLESANKELEHFRQQYPDLEAVRRQVGSMEETLRGKLARMDSALELNMVLEGGESGSGSSEKLVGEATSVSAPAPDTTSNPIKTQLLVSLANRKRLYSEIEQVLVQRGEKEKKLKTLIAQVANLPVNANMDETIDRLERECEAQLGLEGGEAK